MGKPLFRRFLVASAPVSRDSLPGIKIGLEGIEKELSEKGRRTVNLDPGLVTPENFILATGKNFTHRIYLRDGIYAEVTLAFHKTGVACFDWTYPDFKSGRYTDFFLEVRRRHMSALQGRRPGEAIHPAPPASPPPLV